MTDARRCSACRGRNALQARFCRHCGAPLELITPAGEGPEGALPLLPRLSSAPPFDDRRLFRELCWLTGVPIGISIVYSIYARIAGVSAWSELLAVSSMACVALGGSLLNRRLVLPALRWPSWRDLGLTLLVALVAGPALTFGFWLLKQAGFFLFSDYLEPYLRSGWPSWVGYADMAILTPISEELLFRGLIQPKLEQVIKPTEALIVQAALFSAVHLSPVILVTHFCMGLAFGWVRRRSGSVVPGMLLHGGWNAWVVWSALGN